MRFNKIQSDILNFGTSEKMFKKTNLTFVREFMIPDSKSHSLKYGRLKPTKDFLMFEHNSMIKRIWSILLIFLLLYTAIVTPFRIALVEDDNHTFYIIDSVVDFLFMFDILVNFNSPI